MNERLKRKVNANLAEYMRRWLDMTPEQLIDNSEEIATVKWMAGVLPEMASEDDAQYLLNFKNPLEVVSDQWSELFGSNARIVDEEMGNVLWQITDKRDADSIYEMDDGQTDAQAEGGMTFG